MPGFQENIVVLGPMCDTNRTVTLSKHPVNIYSLNGNPLITGWREPDRPCIWHIYLLPNPEDILTLSLYYKSYKTFLKAFSAYDLPSVKEIVCYFHAATDFPVRNTWL